MLEEIIGVALVHGAIAAFQEQVVHLSGICVEIVGRFILRQLAPAPEIIEFQQYQAFPDGIVGSGFLDFI